MLKDRIKAKIKNITKDYIAEKTDPQVLSREVRTQALAASANMVGSMVAGEIILNSMQKDIEKRIGKKKDLTKKDVEEAIKVMGIKKKPVIVMNSPIPGGSNAFAHPARGLSKWFILKSLKNQDIRLHKKVKKEYDKVKGKGHYAIHLGKNMNDLGTLSHELGHVKNREILQKYLGKYPERAVTFGMHSLTGVGLMPIVKSSPITAKDAAKRTAMVAPLLAEEFFASRHAKKDVKKLDKQDKKELNKAYGTYLFAATSPARQKVLYDLIKKMRD